MKKIQNVLLVDDDEDDLFLLSEALQESAEFLKYNFAFNGKEAIEYLSKTKVLPELIFLDINMHVMNGLEFLSIIKNDLRYMKIPVIILTTSTSLKEKEQTLRLGARYFITKPHHYEELKSIVKTTMEKLSYF